MADVIYTTKQNLDRFTQGIPFNINTISIILFCAMYSSYTLMLLVGLVVLQLIYSFYKMFNRNDRILKYFCKQSLQLEFTGEHSFLILGFLTFFLTMVQKGTANNSSFGLTFLVMLTVSILFLFITVDQKPDINNQRILFIVILGIFWILGSILGATCGNLAGSMYQESHKDNNKSNNNSKQSSDNITCDQDDLETNYICQEYKNNNPVFNSS
tara:strand:- start:338 stop:976 length:639 start_codon:yes stop_codon:yes gene_type:complete